MEAVKWGEMSTDEVFSTEICTGQPTCLLAVVLPPESPWGVLRLAQSPARHAGSPGPLSRAMANTGNARVHSRTSSLGAGNLVMGK